MEWRVYQKFYVYMTHPSRATFLGPFTLGFTKSVMFHCLHGSHKYFSMDKLPWYFGLPNAPHVLLSAALRWTGKVEGPSDLCRAIEE